MHYRYSVKEVPVPGYTSEVSADQVGQIIITNTRRGRNYPTQAVSVIGGSSSLVVHL